MKIIKNGLLLCYHPDKNSDDSKKVTYSELTKIIIELTRDGKDGSFDNNLATLNKIRLQLINQTQPAATQQTRTTYPSSYQKTPEYQQQKPAPQPQKHTHSRQQQDVERLQLWMIEKYNKNLVELVNKVKSHIINNEMSSKILFDNINMCIQYYAKLKNAALNHPSDTIKSTILQLQRTVEELQQLYVIAKLKDYIIQVNIQFKLICDSYAKEQKKPFLNDRQLNIQNQRKLDIALTHYKDVTNKIQILRNQFNNKTYIFSDAFGLNKSIELLNVNHEKVILLEKLKNILYYLKLSKNFIEQNYSENIIDVTKKVLSAITTWINNELSKPPQLTLFNPDNYWEKLLTSSLLNSDRIELAPKENLDRTIKFLQDYLNESKTVDITPAYKNNIHYKYKRNN